jgi:hypothetical protein
MLAEFRQYAIGQAFRRSSESKVRQVIDCDQRTVLKTGRSIQPESQIDAADPNRGFVQQSVARLPWATFFGF